MKSRKKFVVIIVFLFGLAGGLYGLADYRQNQVPTYTVVRVIDGDTIEVGTANKTQSVRLLGVDAPEQYRCFAEESSIFLSEHILGKQVTLFADPLNEDTDDYGRLLRYVYLNDALINAQIIEQGFARHLSSFPIIQNENFSELEKEAEENDFGLWGEC